MKKLVKVERSSDAHWVGDGFAVSTVFSSHTLGHAMSPFLLMDYAAPKEFAPSSKQRGVGQHPHRGFETVTIVYQGELEHCDIGGNQGKLGPGDVQWMTAASGVLYEEMHAREFSRKGDTPCR